MEKPLGNYRMSSFTAKSFIKLGEKTVLKIITKAPAPDESSEFFRNREQMKELAESEEDMFTEALNSMFTTASHKRTLQKVHTGSSGQLHAHYQFYMAEVYLIDKNIIFEMYLQVNSTKVSQSAHAIKFLDGGDLSMKYF